MELLNWEGINTGPGSLSLREVVENMRKAGALLEILGVVQNGPDDEYDNPLAEELVLEAGCLVDCLGMRALELLDAQAVPGVTTTARRPRRRTAKRGAA